MTNFDNLRRLDSICDSFESNWSEAGTERICQLVQEVNQELQRELLKQLLWVDLDLRRDRGHSTELRIYEQLLTPYASEIQSAYDEYMNRLSAIDTSKSLTQLVSTGTKISLQSPLPLNSLLGKYQIEKCIGSGSLGFVYLATELSTRSSVAIKIPDPKVCDLELFIKQAVACSKLTHPNICELYSVAEQTEQPYIVYRYIEGKSLASLIRSRELSIEESLKIVGKLCDVFQYAHSQGVIHRDIKPANILINNSLEPLVTDFGLAEALSYNGVVQNHREQVGTLYYSAPEQLMGAAANEQTDIFSLGALLYELIAGHRPFVGASIGQITANVLRCEPSRPSTQNPEVPLAVDAVCLKALKRDHKQRFQSMQEFGSALASAQRASNKRKNKRRSKIIALGLIAGVIAIMTAAITTYYFAFPSGATNLPEDP